jgi:hypothetical protein
MKYRVRYYKEEVSTVRYDIDVEADSPEEARERVRANMTGEIEDLTDEEIDSEASGKEELDSSTFSALEDESDSHAVVEVTE